MKSRITQVTAAIVSRGAPLFLMATLLLLGASHVQAQSPTSIAGRAAILTTTSGTGLYPSSGSFRFLPAATGNIYGIIAISGPVESSYGTYSYQKNGANGGLISYTDVNDGAGFVANVNFTSATGGTYVLSNSNLPGSSETGTFHLYSATAPSSVSGYTFQLGINAGVYPFATSGSQQLSFASSGTGYSITGASSSTGNYSTYSVNNTASSTAAFTDSVSGTSNLTLSWDTATTGAYLFLTSSNQYEAGTFTATPPSADTLGGKMQSSGLWKSPWFGYYTPEPFPFIYHYNLGYEYVFDGGGGGAVYLYDYHSGHFWYTTPAYYPFIYDFSLQAFLYYYTNNANGAKRYFSEFGAHPGVISE